MNGSVAPMDKQAQVVSSEALDMVFEFLDAKSKWSVVLCSLALIFLFGYIDWVTGWELTAFLFYAVPLLLTSLRGYKSISYALAALCTLIWWAANITENPFVTNYGFSWAVCARGIFFLLTVTGGLSAHKHHHSLLAQIDALECSRYLEQQLAIAGGHLVNAIEGEQQRLSRDLHDGISQHLAASRSISQHLAAIRYAASSLGEKLDARSAPELRLAQDLENMAKSAADQLREFTQQVNPVRLEDLGLASVLKGRIFLGPLLKARKPRLDSASEVVKMGELAQWVVYVGKWLENQSHALCLFTADQAPWTSKELPVLNFNKQGLDLLLNKGTQEDWLPEDWPPVSLKITVERIA